MALPDKEARFMAIVNDNRSLLYKVCHMYASDKEHFRDLYQEVLANIWEGIGGFRGEAAVSTWIYRIAINTCVTFFRHHNRHDSSKTYLDMAYDIEDDNGERNERLREMYRLISRLDKIDKAIILMWLDERSYDEIAEVTGFTRNNVATRLHRIKQRLAENSSRNE